MLQDNIKFFRDNGVAGLFEQGNGEAISGEFGELRVYLISKLMWNPDIDVSETMDEFLQGYYGRAGIVIRKYIDMMSEALIESHAHMSIYSTPNLGHITSELLDKAEELFDKAEMLADDDNILVRVQKSRLQIRYLRLYITPIDDPSYAAQAEKLIFEIKRFGLSFIKEHVPLEKSFDMLRTGDLPRARF